MLRVTQELRRVLAPHGSICIELGDTYAGSGGAGGDYDVDKMRDGQLRWVGSAAWARPEGARHPSGSGEGWPLAKSKALIAELYRIALAYGINPLTGQPSPAGRWRIRNVVTWVRPNPPVGALGDKWRPATSDLVIACTSEKRYWDDLATRKPNARIHEVSRVTLANGRSGRVGSGDRGVSGEPKLQNSFGAPLLDWWEIPPGGFKGAHYAVFPPELIAPCVQAMCPPRVCRICGEPSRRITESEYVSHNPGTVERQHQMPRGLAAKGSTILGVDESFKYGRADKISTTLGWTDCGHGDNYRSGLVLDPFAGSGTTLVVATGHGRDAIGIDLDARNVQLVRERVGLFLVEEVRGPDVACL